MASSPTPTGRCLACRFVAADDPHGYLQYQCRRRAPAPHIGEASRPGWPRMAEWPTVQHDDWCGDFTERPNHEEHHEPTTAHRD